jgi:hypothetical protein
MLTKKCLKCCFIIALLKDEFLKLMLLHLIEYASSDNCAYLGPLREVK